MNVDSPETPHDVLVVVGGPTGTAAAFRAHELGLSVKVIDRDGVLSIVKQWGEHQPEPKDVDADYGDLVDLIFPKGGALVSQLPFEDQTPADQLYARWMKVYDDNGVASVPLAVTTGGGLGFSVPSQEYSSYPNSAAACCCSGDNSRHQ